MTKKLKSGTPFVYDENDRVVGIRDPHTGTDTDLVTAVTSPGGGVVNSRRRPVLTTAQRSAGTMADLRTWMRPTHLPIVTPAEHHGMTPIVSGLLTISHDTTEREFSRSSIKYSFSGATRVSSVRLPLPAGIEIGVSGAKRKAAGAIHFRVKCSDWSKINRLYFGLTEDGGTAKAYTLVLINNAKSIYGVTDPAYAARWAGWRTFVMTSNNFIKAGDATPWGVESKYHDNIDGFTISAITTGAVDLWVNRVYSPDWPCGVITPIFDGWYSTARDVVLSKRWLDLKWGAGGSANKVSGEGIYPSYGDLKNLSDHGYDVFTHGHILSGSSPAPTTDTTTEEEFIPILAAQRRALLNAGVDPQGMRWAQWLQAGGRGTMDIVPILKSVGVNAGRSEGNDSEFGVHPWNVAYTGPTTLLGPASFVSGRGRFSRRYTAGYSSSSGENYFAERGDPVHLTCRETVTYTAKAHQFMTMYDHEVTDVLPIGMNVNIKAMQDRMDHMEAEERAGNLLILNPTGGEELTYWREGEWFVRWDGECVYRHDPTTIAF